MITTAVITMKRPRVVPDEQYECRRDHQLVRHGVQELAHRRRDPHAAGQVAVERISDCGGYEHDRGQWVRPGMAQ